MKLYVRHEFDCTPEMFWKMYWDDRFDAMLRKSATVDRELLSEEKSADAHRRRIRFTPHKELPRAIASLLGSKKLIYEQDNTFEPARSRMLWQVIPTILPGKLTAKGTFQVNSTPNGCAQVIDGEIKVNVRFVGGKIEQAVVAEVVKSYEQTAKTSREWLKKFGG